MIGYFTDLAEANALIAAKRFETEAWDDIPTDPKKEACLWQAYDRIFYSKEFILPTPAEATVDDMVVLKKGQMEMAYYLALLLASEDRRKGIQAQGTIEAGVVKEKYKEGALNDTPIPPFVRDLLCGYLAGTAPVEFGMENLCRDEEEEVDTDVCDI